MRFDNSSLDSLIESITEVHNAGARTTGDIPDHVTFWFGVFD
jgi:hypothetical protein